MYYFHVSRRAREKYQFDESLFSYDGNVIFANFHAARNFAQKINQKKDLLRFPEQAISAGYINGMGLIDEIFHLVIHLYGEQNKDHPSVGGRVMERAVEWVETKVGKEELTKTLNNFNAEFPTGGIYQGKISPQQYLDDKTGDIPNREKTLEELLLLWLANKNPALEVYAEIFDDSGLGKESAYKQVVESLRSYFKTLPGFGPESQDLVAMLRNPMIAIPHSISGQLEYIREHWAGLLGSFLYRLLTSMDFLKEEEKLRLVGPGPVMIPVYDRLKTDLEPEKFSQDKSWMINLVLIAKNIYVWMYQLSQKYNREISCFDQIPEEELGILAESGINGIWLIGVWERSKASANIKKMCGNPEALASAYSLLSYEIAQDLGGEEALEVFRQRAWSKGIRLGSDMVPNHMGIDSNWVVQHPDWFIGSEYSPFPGYTFNGPDLLPDAPIQIRIEDHYYDRTDAAVVFQRKNSWTNETRYIYHGNDGTSMPWNDTAQLNYLIPEVREMVIQTILSVAQKFPIIRFDAAMTLTRQHFQRLWFPEPGSGGDIPSRAECGLRKDAFDQLMPVEFWREVVDRAAEQTPDVLLLAEAFWLLEGYFVRTLGMHRVYNSAFMVMMRDEDNAKYRSVMKNTLAFEPEILRRFVNFMNNPDERTSIDQYGKGDKYFGICTLMVTLPGLPMIGHGQIEGYTEKYGMEYRRAYLDESPDGYLVERHRREIFPLLKKRYLFSGVTNFALFDFKSNGDFINEDVITYTNYSGKESALVVYHNKYATTDGWIHTSVPLPVKATGNERSFVQKSLVEGLNLKIEDNQFLVFKDHVRNLEYICPGHLLNNKGLYLHLDAYQYYVFGDFRVVVDDQWHSYQRIYDYLKTNGVPSIEEAIRLLYLQPVQHPFMELVNQGYFFYLLDIIHQRIEIPDQMVVLGEFKAKYDRLIAGIMSFTQTNPKNVSEITRFTQKIFSIGLGWQTQEVSESKAKLKWLNKAQKMIAPLDFKDDLHWISLLGWLCMAKLGKIVLSSGMDVSDYRQISLAWFDEWQFSTIMVDAIKSLGFEDGEAWSVVNTIRMLIQSQDWHACYQQKSPAEILQAWLSTPVIQQYLGVNRYDGILWFNAEAVKKYLWWMKAIPAYDILQNDEYNHSQKLEMMLAIEEIVDEIEGCVDVKVCQVEKWLACVKQKENEDTV